MHGSNFGGKVNKAYKPGKYFTGQPCKNGHVAERWNYNGICVICKRDSDRASNLKAGKKYRIKKLYGLTQEQVQIIAENQTHQCAICDKPFEEKVQIDHCHKTGIIRGLLCINCNWLLGKAYDDPKLLRKAAQYLEKVRDEISID